MARGVPDEGIVGPEVSPEELPRHIVPRYTEGTTGPDFSQGLNAVGDALQKKYVADSATAAGNDLAAFREKVTAAHEVAKQKIGDGNPDGFTAGAMSDFDKAAEPIMEGAADNPVMRGMVTKGVQELREHLYADSLQFEGNAGVAYRTNSLTNNLQSQLPVVRAHPDLADSIGSTLHDQARGTGMTPEQLYPFMRNMDGQISLNAGLGRAESDPIGTWRQLHSGIVTDPSLARITEPTARAQVMESARHGMVSAYGDQALQSFQALGPAAGNQIFAQVDKLDVPPDVKDDIRTEIEKRHGQMIQQNQTAQGPAFLSVDRDSHLKDPPPGTEDRVMDLWRKNALSGPEAGSYLAEIANNRAKVATAAVDDGYLQKAWNGEALLDPTDKDMREAASDYFNRMVTKNSMPVGTPRWINFAAEFTKRMGIVPDMVEDFTIPALMNGHDAPTVMAAVEAIDRVREANPRSFAWFDQHKEATALADEISHLTQAGLPPGRAITLARANAAMPQVRREQLDKDLEAAKLTGPKDTALAGALESNMARIPGFRSPGTLWGTNAIAPPREMQTDYQNLVQQLYRQYGADLPRAQSDAAATLARVWKPTQMNGSWELTKYAPEAMYPGLTPQAIRDDVANKVAAEPHNFDTWDAATGKVVNTPVDPTGIHLVRTTDTDKSSGLKWGLVYVDPKTGAPDTIVNKDGSPYIYSLPVSSAAEFHASRAAAQARLEQGKLKELREANAKRAAELEAAAAGEPGSIAYDRKLLESLPPSSAP